VGARSWDTTAPALGTAQEKPIPRRLVPSSGGATGPTGPRPGAPRALSNQKARVDCSPAKKLAARLSAPVFRNGTSTRRQDVKPEIALRGPGVGPDIRLRIYRQRDWARKQRKFPFSRRRKKNRQLPGPSRRGPASSGARLGAKAAVPQRIFILPVKPGKNRLGPFTI